MRAQARQWSRVDAAIIVGLALLAFIPYFQTRSFQLVNFDDNFYITQVPQVCAGLSWSGIRWALTTLTQSNWHPLTWISYMLDVSLFDVSSGAFHLHNAMLHALNASLLFVVLFRLTGNRWAGAVTALLFAVHPLRVESVAWVSERKDVLSTAMWLVTILIYDTYVRRGGFARAPLWYAATLGGFVLALSAKSMAISLPFVLLLLDFWPLRRVDAADVLNGNPAALRQAGRLALEKLPMFLIVGAASALTIYSQSVNQNWGTQLPFGIRLANATVSSVRYLWMTIAPYGLIVFYPHPATAPGGHVPAWQLIISIAILLSVTVLAIATLRRTPWIAFGWFWYLVTVLPVLGIVQVGAQAMADRYTYIPTIGVVIAVVWSLQKWQRPVTVFAAIAAVALLVVTWRQVGYWRDSKTLMDRCLAVNTNNYLAHNNLGDVYAHAGDETRASAEFQEALREYPGYELARVNLANAYMRRGMINEALDIYNLHYSPQLIEPLHSMATTFAADGNFSLAARLWETILAVNPKHAPSQQGYGLVMILLGKDKIGIDHLRIALELEPDNVTTLDRLAWALATHPSPSLADPKAAETLARKAVQLTKSRLPQPLDTLAAALARQYRFAEAIPIETDALRLAEQAHQVDLERHIRDRLKLYQDSKPFISSSRANPATTRD